MRAREMIEPLNQDDRKRAIAKFMVVCCITLLLIPCIVFIYDQFPQSYAAKGKAGQMAETSAAAMPQTSETIEEKLQRAVLERSNINLTLLVDATPGMEDFVGVVADVADSINRSYALDMLAACYRDAAEGQWMYLDNDMTGEPPAVWLRNLSTTVLYDKDEPEAVYYGLRQALRSSHLAEGESNILVLIGDAGNHAQEAVTDVPASDIVDLLINKGCYMAAIQTRQPASSPAFAAFGKQIRSEIMVPALQRYQDNSLTRENHSDGTSMTSDRKYHYYLFTPGKNQRLTREALSNKMLSYLHNTISSIYSRVRAVKALQDGKATDEDMALLVPFLRDYGISKQDLQLYRASASAR